MISKAPVSIEPTSDQIKALPTFATLGRDRITLVSSAKEAEHACAALTEAEFLGFDTESRPTFTRGEQSDGPHLLQFATLEKAWVIQLHNGSCREIVLQWLRESNVRKAGFAIHHDCKRIEQRFGVKPQGILDLNAEFRRLGHKNEVGVVRAVAVLFGKRFVRSSGAAKTNWSRTCLTNSQVLYAANDAYAAANVYHALAPVLQK